MVPVNSTEHLPFSHQNHGSHQSSPTTPNGSPRSPPFSSSSLSLTPGTQGSTASSRSAPPTPSHTAQVSTLDSLSSFHADGLQSAVSSGKYIIIVIHHCVIPFTTYCMSYTIITIVQYFVTSFFEVSDGPIL